MSHMESILKEYLIIPDYLLPTDTEYLKNEEDYGSLETCLANESWNVFFDCNFEISELKKKFDGYTEQQKVKMLKFGVGCFIQFVLCNFTGPDIDGLREQYLKTDRFQKIPFSKHLSVNNEEINANTKSPALLFTSKMIFEWCIVNNVINNWWHWRSILIHQEILDELSPTLLSEADRLYKLFQGNLNLPGSAKACLDIEIAQLYLLFHNVSKAREHILSASEILGVTYELVGLMGKRTKHQEKDVAQLSIKVNVDKQDSSNQRLTVESTDVPNDIPLNDDVRLNKIEFTERKEDDVMLTNLEQKLFLTIVQEILVSKPKDELQVEELQPFINFILAQSNTYSVRVVALLLRCKFESKNRRTIQRSLMQYEEIIRSWAKEVPHSLDRAVDVFGTGLPPIWEIETQYARLLLNIGLVKNALEIYLEIMLWEEVIVCYTILKLRHKAADIIKEQLNEKPTVKLWCLLGDATDDISCYEKAWELSKRRSHRAQRHWGQYLFACKRYEECIPHFEKSVSINPLQSIVWFKLGYAALQVENWQIAATAYRRYTTLEPDSFEAWNNLAQAYIKIGNNRTAHQALHEAIKCNYENWKVWENLLVVSCDIANISDMIRAYHNLLDLKEKYLNLNILNILVLNVCNDMNDCDGQTSNKFLQKTRELIGRVTAIYPGEGFVWELYANLAPALLLRAQRLQRAYRGYTQGEWNKNPKSCQQVLHVCNKMAEIVLEDEIDPRDTIVTSVRLTLSSALAAVKRQDWEETKESVDIVTNQLQKILEKMKRVEANTKTNEP